MAKTPKTKPETPPAPPVVTSFTVKTQNDVANFFGVSFQTVKDWGRKGMPREPKAYDLSLIARWLLDQARRQTPSESQDTKRSLEIEKLEQEVRARTRENLKEEGELIDRRQVESELALLIIEARKVFEGLPVKLQPMLPRGSEHLITAEIRREIHQALHELADRMAMVGPQARNLAERIERLEAELASRPDPKKKRARKSAPARSNPPAASG